MPNTIYSKQMNLQANHDQAPLQTSVIAPIGCVMAILKILRDIHSDITVSTALTFAYIANHPGITQTEIEKHSGMLLAAINRHVTILGPWNVKEKTGYGFISVDVDPYDRRRKLLHLTTTGHVLIGELSDRINRHQTPTMGSVAQAANLYEGT
ncbi:hypothetical protein DBR37_05775 [Herminiimonas sp. KBW02]|uniref:hypothetical protein n=1 Tax=Herminiimonas sp. KBW02 TaxID=2153363 RepID=UPI000F5A1358|nr:hypothetical protein [Herminiimonas sp. KBW02]RQO35867.1 hypothetical protein DBR37_05775 [Herminiimonas sp. KBW02]